jgi:hypothetical protein
MDDEGSKNMETFSKGEHSGKMFNDGDVLQPIWVRCCSVLSYYCDREYLERQFNHVLNLGVIFWSIFLLSQKF